MSTIFITIQFILVAVICVCVLLQKSSSIGLGAYSGSNESLFGAKGPAGFLAKLTFFLGFLLVANTIYLGYQFNRSANSSLIDKVDLQKIKSALPSALPAETTRPTESPVSTEPSNPAAAEQNETK